MNFINYADLIINSIILIIIIVAIIIGYRDFRKSNISIKMIISSDEYPRELFLLIIIGFSSFFIVLIIISILFNLNILTIK